MPETRCAGPAKARGPTIDRKFPSRSIDERRAASWPRASVSAARPPSGDAANMQPARRHAAAEHPTSRQLRTRETHCGGEEYGLGRNLKSESHRRMSATSRNSPPKAQQTSVARETNTRLSL